MTVLEDVTTLIETLAPNGIGDVPVDVEKLR